MEFKAVYGSHHVLEPLGYGIMRKTVKRRAPVRSAVEQYSIHNLAYMFHHPHLKTVKPLELESARSYTMEQLYEGVIIPERDYSKFPDLFVGLMEFQQYMAHRGYWAWGYKVIWNGKVCILLDYSRFGTIDRDRVRFPGERVLRSVDNIEERFHLVAPLPAPTPAPMSLEDQLRAPLQASGSVPSTLSIIQPAITHITVDMDKIEDWGFTVINDDYFDFLSSQSS